VNRFQFYEHVKDCIASPPDVLRIDEKNLREYSIMNVTGVVITTNHKTDGLFLPPDDRRHFVAWSELAKSHFTPDEWSSLWAWYEQGGYQDIAAYLAELDISKFNPKAPPPKTEAFWAIADANRAPEDAELADVLDEMGNPQAFVLPRLIREAGGREIAGWLRDRKNRRVIPHRLESCGYVPVRNGARKTGLWVVNKTRQVIYALASLSIRDRLRAASGLADGSKNTEGTENTSADSSNIYPIKPNASQYGS
jgi:hypothetical protein